MKHTFVLVMLVFLAGCRSEPPRPAPATATWRAVQTWSGRGSTQLETFVIDAGTWRTRWETRNESPPGSGYFKLTAHSADSGRVIAELADHQGVGRGTGNVTEAPRRYYLTVDSANVDWTITAEEPRR